jgi:hypothetical protein
MKKPFQKSSSKVLLAHGKGLQGRVACRALCLVILPQPGLFRPAQKRIRADFAAAGR